jgi:hypothetical protein
VEEVHLKTAVVGEGRNQRRVRLYGEASPFDGTMKAVPAEITMCKGIGRLLEFHYPGHPWAVEVNMKQGYAKVSIPDLLGPNWGYVILLSDMSDQMVVKAGGEILERFKIPRNRIDVAHYLSLETKLPLLGRYRAKDGNRIPA